MSDVSLSKAVRSNLLSLQNTATMMAKTQERLATGNKVNSALDNPTNFFTASALNSRAGDLNSLIDGMANGVKTLEAADNGLSAITKTLESMQSTLRQARQDKSFQVASFDVGSASKLSIAGGTLPEGIEVSLPEPGPGSKAKVTSAAAYTGPALGGSAAGGARVDITWNATMNGKTDITVDGHEIDLTGITGAEDIATAIQGQLDTAAAGAYSVSEADGVISIEKTDTTAASPAVNLGTSAAVAGSATFTFDPVRMGNTINVDGNDVTVDGDLASFTAALQTELGADYTVSSDADTNEISITSNTTGAGTTPVVTGGSLAATAASGAFTLDKTDAFSLTIDGTTKTFAAGTADADIVSAFQDDAGFDADWNISVTGGAFEVLSKTTGAQAAPTIEAQALASTSFDLDTTAGQDLVIGGVTKTLGVAATDDDVLTAFNGDPAFSGDYTLVSDGAGKFTVITNTAGDAAVAAGAITSDQGAQLTNVAANAAVAVDAEALATSSAEAGLAAVNVTTQAGADGTASVSSEAPADAMTITYGNKSVNLTISRGTNAEMAASINDQLEDAGIAVTAAFDDDGNLSFEANSAEAKTLVVSGSAAGTVFGDESVNVGVAAEKPLNATKSVDQFVEKINANYGTSIRASNDNGRLRIENLSTSEMTVGVDKEGTGDVATPTKIGGNTVRDGLAGQFNELKDQLNKLADDASFNGINLLRGDQLTITFNETGNSFMQIKAGDSRGINSQTLNIEDLVGADFDSDANIDDLLGDIKLALNSVRSQASAFGSNLSIVQNRQDFTKNMINTLQTGAANLTLADMNEEAANLLALQTRQSLSSSALSMASQADQSVLQLLR